MTLGLWLENLLAYSLQLAILAAMATLLPWILKLRHPGVLLRYWQAVFAACLLLPVVQSWRSVPLETISLNGLGTVRVDTSISVAAAAPVNPSLPSLLIAALLFGSLLRFTWLALGFYRLKLYLKKSSPLMPLPKGVVEMCGLVGVSPSICFSREITSPVAFGFWKPAILVPTNFLEMSGDFQKAISCHELWHVRRNDWLSGLLEEIAVAILWFHPAVWWLTNRIQLSREEVIDRLVLKTTGERKPYLDALLQTALTARAEFAFVPRFLARHHLTQRVALIVTEVTMSRTRLAFALTLSLILLAFTGRFATKAFPLESPSTTDVQAPLVPQDPGAVSTPTPVSLAVPEEELSQKIVRKVNPVYAVEAKKQGIQGEVLLAVSVNAKGEMENVQIQRGHPLLVRAAVDSVQQWKYAPYLKDGVAVPVTSTVIVNFALQDPAKPGERPSALTTIRLGSNLLAAKLVSRVEPIYPLEAKQKHIEGEVLFEVTIDEQGDVIDVQVLGGNAILVGAAYDAVKQWHYTPILLNGSPVRARANVSIKFELAREKAAVNSAPDIVPPAAVVELLPAEWVHPQPEEIRRRVEYANVRFAPDGVSGSKTDRGRTYVTLGPPYQIESHPSGALGTDEPFETWVFRAPTVQLFLTFVGEQYRLASANRGPNHFR